MTKSAKQILIEARDESIDEPNSRLSDTLSGVLSGPDVDPMVGHLVLVMLRAQCGQPLIDYERRNKRAEVLAAFDRAIAIA